jgi:hypothetical protein
MISPQGSFDPSTSSRLAPVDWGNFIFDQDWSRPSMESMLIRFCWQIKTLCSIRLVPTIDEHRCQPHMETPKGR